MVAEADHAAGRAQSIASSILCLLPSCLLSPMFDALKNLSNLPSLLSKAREMQEKMQQAREELGRKTVSADAGGGMVEATVNGQLELVKLRIDKSKIDPNDTELLEDVTVAAVRAAHKKASEMVRQEMEKATGGLGLPPGMIPGM